VVLNDYVVHFISGTVSPKEDKYKTSVAQVGTVSIETGNSFMEEVIYLLDNENDNVLPV
jgi:hypothetical protein